MSDELKKRYDDLMNHTDGHGWYWCSVGEKCYHYCVATAFPANEGDKYPPSGGKLVSCIEDDGVWLAEDGTKMFVDQWLVDVEQQNGDCICRFISQAYADVAQLTAATQAREQAEREAAACRRAMEDLSTENNSLTAANAELVEFVRSLNRCVTEVNDHREKGYKGTMSVDAKYWMIESERVLKTLAAHPAGEKHEQQYV